MQATKNYTLDRIVKLVSRLALGCFGILNSASESAAADSIAKVPVVYSVSRGTYTTPEGRAVVLDWSIHQPITPYPNVVWNQSKQAYQTLDGSPIPRVDTQHGASGIPVEAIDPYWGVSGNGNRLRTEMSVEGRNAGKIPVYYDPNRYGYFDAADRPMQSWSVATHELVQPKPNVVWNAETQGYTTRDGSPLPWIKDARGWEGIPVEAIDPSMGAYSPGIYSSKRGSSKPEDTVADFSKQLGAHKQISNMKALMEDLFQRGVKVPPNVLPFLRQLEMGSEGRLKDSLPDAGKSLQQLIDANKEKSSPPPAARKIRPLTVFNIRPEEVAAARQQALAQSQPQLRGGALREMEQLNADIANAVASGRVSDAGTQVFFNRYLDISQRMAGEMSAFSSGMANWNQINQMRAHQEDISRMMRAARAEDVRAVSSAAISLMDKLPASVGKPAKTYIERMHANSSRKPSLLDPLTGRTDLDEEGHAATADFFADLIKNNPEGKDHILAEMTRVDAVNDQVHEWNRELGKAVDSVIRNTYDTDRRIANASGYGNVPVWDNPLFKDGNGEPRRVTADERFNKLSAMIDRKRVAEETWYESHRLGAMVANRLGGGGERVAQPGLGGLIVYNSDGSAIRTSGGPTSDRGNGTMRRNSDTSGSPELQPSQRPDLRGMPRNPAVINDAGGRRGGLNFTPSQLTRLKRHYADLKSGAISGYGGSITVNPDGSLSQVPGGRYVPAKDGSMVFDFSLADPLVTGSRVPDAPTLGKPPKP